MDEPNKSFSTATIPSKWSPFEEKSDENSKIPGFEELMSEIRTDLQMARQEEEEILGRIKGELQKTEKTLGAFD